MGLPPGEVWSTALTWDTSGVEPGNYTIWAEAAALPGELILEDNRLVDGFVLLVGRPKANFTFSPEFPMPGENVVFNASPSKPNGGFIELYEWDFGDGEKVTSTEPLITHAYLKSGLYNVSLTVFDSEGLWDSTWRTVYVCMRDISIVNVSVSTNQVYVGRKVSINVTVSNNGEKVEDFQLILYYNFTGGNVIGVVGVVGLNPGEFRVLNFVWDTGGVQPCRSYVVTAYVPQLLGERNIGDNVVSGSMPIKVKMVGDVNGDSKIDVKDVAAVSKAFGKRFRDEGWNGEADINGDLKIDIFDVALVSKSFGTFC